MAFIGHVTRDVGYGAKKSVCVAVYVGGVNHLLREASPTLRQDNPLPRLSSPHSPESGGDSCWFPYPCARFIVSATSGTCGTADTQIHTHSERAHSHTHTHRHTPAGASQRQHVDAASAYPTSPTPRGLRPHYPPSSSPCNLLPFLLLPQDSAHLPYRACVQGSRLDPEIWGEGGA